MYSSWYMALTVWVTSPVTCLVWSSLYVFYLKNAHSRLMSMYSCLSCITTVVYTHRDWWWITKKHVHIQSPTTADWSQSSGWHDCGPSRVGPTTQQWHAGGHSNLTPRISLHIISFRHLDYLERLHGWKESCREDGRSSMYSHRCVRPKSVHFMLFTGAVLLSDDHLLLPMQRAFS